MEDKKLKQFPLPFPHCECGLGCRKLGEEPCAGPWLAWDELAVASLQAAQSLATGPFGDLDKKLPALAGYADKAVNYKEEPAPTNAAGG